MYEMQGWLKSKGFSGFNNDWYSRLADLDFSDQVLFIRKLIECHRLGKITITSERLALMMKGKRATISGFTSKNIQGYNRRVATYDKGIDVSIYLILQYLYTILKDDRLPYIMELYRTLSIAYETHDKHEKFQAILSRMSESNLFNLCGFAKRRLTIKRKYPAAGEFCVKYAALLIIHKDKTSSFSFNNTNIANHYKLYLQSKTNGIIQVLQVNDNIPDDLPSSNEIKILATQEAFNYVIDYLFSLVIDKNMDVAIQLEGEYEKSYHLSNMAPYNIRFCEGYDAKQPHKLIQKAFKWCGGSAYFGCRGLQYSQDYRNYTIYDFTNIIKPNRFTKDDILKWYSSINRFNSQIEHLYCRECGNMLEPVYWNKEKRAFVIDYCSAHYATWFTCNNPSCSKKEDIIYLNHCFQRYCGNVIDSRETAKCENGFYICNKCGVCCSEEQFKLKNEAGLTSAHVKYLISNHKMHLDGGKEKIFFCPKCGKRLIKHTTREFSELNTTIDKEEIWWECEDHSDYIGVFPKTYETKQENDSILTLLDYMDYHYLE